MSRHNKRLSYSYEVRDTMCEEINIKGMFLPRICCANIMINSELVGLKWSGVYE